MGLGAVCSGATRITDEMFLSAAETLARQVEPDDLALGRVYPGLDRIREVSVEIAAAVADIAWRDGLATVERPDDVHQYIRGQMFEPLYPHYA